MNTLTVALAQINIALGDPAANIARLPGLAAEAKARGAGLLVLPELWSSGYDLERASELAVALDDGAFSAMAEQARRNQLAICGSALACQPGRRGQPLERASQPTNTAALYNADGLLVLAYSKLHLFGLMREDQFLAPGDDAPLAETPWGNIALAICYDLRFPELFRSYAVRGASVIIMPAEWPHPRVEHWRTLVRARAIENQCFVVACNRVGSDRANQFCGRSLVVDPWGNTLAEGGDAEELLIATFDLALVATVRERMSVLRDRRPEYY